MGFFSSLLDKVTPTLTNAISKAANKATKSLLYGDVGSTGSINSDDYSMNIVHEIPYEQRHYADVFAKPEENNGVYQNVYDGAIVYEEDGEFVIEPDPNSKLLYTAKREIGNHNQSATSSNENKWLSTSENNYNPLSSLAIPRWGIKDFINERVSWQKSLDSITGEPGWFYFKIFFKFDTNYGLFGGIMQDNGTNFSDSNTAVSYLSHATNTYSNDRLAHSLLALNEFTRNLSFISSRAPWFFKQVSGMEEIGQIETNDLSKTKYINIGCSEDAIDMRLTTLMDMYKFAVYDTVNNKELVPENLRKFDMSVVVFNTPLRYYQTGGKSLTQGSYPYKNMYADNLADRMSFKMITFKDCEFVYESMNSLPGELNNESAFSLAKNNIKISYSKAYTTHLNEWYRTMISDTGGMLWRGGIDSEKQIKRIKALQYALDHAYYRNDKSITYKALVDASEDLITDAMRMIKPEDAFGNLYGQVPR